MFGAVLVIVRRVSPHPGLLPWGEGEVRFRFVGARSVFIGCRLRAGSWRCGRWGLALREEVAEEKADADGVAGLWGVGRDAQSSVIYGFDFLDSFVTFNAEERIACAHGVAI